MYLNTFITLEENINGYTRNNNPLTGHVTISKPGRVKLYIDNLKDLSAKNYVCYVMSKSKNNSARLGEINVPSSNKQTNFKIDLKDVQGKGFSAADIDGVAIVVEGVSIGNTDVVLSGYSGNKYIPSPLLQKSLPKEEPIQKKAEDVLDRSFLKSKENKLEKNSKNSIQKTEENSKPVVTPNPDVVDNVFPVEIPKTPQPVPVETITEKPNKDKIHTDKKFEFLDLSKMLDDVIPITIDKLFNKIKEDISSNSNDKENLLDKMGGFAKEIIKNALQEVIDNNKEQLQTVLDELVQNLVNKLEVVLKSENPDGFVPTVVAETPVIPEIVLPEPNAPVIIPETVLPEPNVPVIVPETVLPEPNVPVIVPETILPEPNVPVIVPETVLPEPNAPVIIPETVLPEPNAPVIIPETPKTPEIPEIPKIPQPEQPKSNIPEIPQISEIPQVPEVTHQNMTLKDFAEFLDTIKPLIPENNNITLPPEVTIKDFANLLNEIKFLLPQSNTTIPPQDMTIKDFAKFLGGTKTLLPKEVVQIPIVEPSPQTPENMTVKDFTKFLDEVKTLIPQDNSKVTQPPVVEPSQPVEQNMTIKDFTKFLDEVKTLLPQDDNKATQPPVIDFSQPIEQNMTIKDFTNFLNEVKTLLPQEDIKVTQTPVVELSQPTPQETEIIIEEPSQQTTQDTSIQGFAGFLNSIKTLLPVDAEIAPTVETVDKEVAYNQKELAILQILTAALKNKEGKIFAQETLNNSPIQQENPPKQTPEELNFLEDLKNKLKELQKTTSEIPTEPSSTTENFIGKDEVVEFDEDEDDLGPIFRDENDIAVTEITQNEREKLDYLFANNMKVIPFGTNKFPIEWVRVSLSELISIPQVSYDWATQPKISQAYHKYGHLIVGKENDKDKYYIGIPDNTIRSKRNSSGIDKVVEFVLKEPRKSRNRLNGYWIAVM